MLSDHKPERFTILWKTALINNPTVLEINTHIFNNVAFKSQSKN